MLRIPNRAKVAIIEGMSGIVASTERVEGFKSALTDEFEVVASQPADWDKNQAYDVMQNILTANPDISIVWAVSSTMGMGAIQAIEDMGMADKIDVYDFDCEADDVQAIKDGKLCATPRYPTQEWAALAFDTALSLVKGETVEENVYTEVQVITLIMWILWNNIRNVKRPAEPGVRYQYSRLCMSIA